MSSGTRGDFSVNRRLFKLILLALPIGMISALLGWVLLRLIALFTNLFFFHTWSFSNQNPALTYGPWTILVPAAGGLIIGLMARYGSERIRGHGIPEALEAILFGKSIMRPKVAILKPVSSAISIGSGGPFGAEGPIIMTGGAFASLLSQVFSLTAAERKTMLVAGAAAGMTAIFGTPMAALLLAVELLLFEWRPRSLIPVGISCLVAFAMRPLVMEGSLPLFPVPSLPELTNFELLCAVPLGLAAGLLSWALSTMLYALEDAFQRLPIHWCWWPALGGLVVGIGGYLDPRVLGVGYEVIQAFLKGEGTPVAAGIFLGIKGLVWAVALASGTSGGVLAPLLMIGSGMGVVLAPWLPGPAYLWPLVGMTGVMGGMMRSPLTAVVFALELTGEIQALPILMVVSFSAYALTVLVMKRSILTEKVARRGFDIFREYAVDPLEQLRAKDIMTRDLETLRADFPMKDLVALFQSPGKKHRGYPVLDESGQLAGIVTATDILNCAWHDGNARVADVPAKRALIVAHADESCKAVAERMSQEEVGRVLVVDVRDSRKLLGIITRSDLLKARHRHYTEEQNRESFFRLKSKKVSQDG
ncbi:MAG TPA: chloride channel protein [Oligoflexus sp.]|uniref:chloride channel protein n=1 Tax=Oligoflexus sp. TaxID=1971216 RepID=UPI002D809B91|nr:chloride channel protein [Oligoflexus sp.]HET9237478.1 chloride channel protein [Oligoflexus sp.]